MEAHYEQINLLKRDKVLQWRMRQELQAENTRLREVVRELVTALEPFADELKEQEVEVPHVTEDESLIHSYTLRLKHLRAARAALSPLTLEEKTNDQSKGE